jgi:hypothetical protein
MTVKNDKGETEVVTDWESYASGYAAAIADVRRPPETESFPWTTYLCAYLIAAVVMSLLFRFFEGEGK